MNPKQALRQSLMVARLQACADVTILQFAKVTTHFTGGSGLHPGDQRALPPKLCAKSMVTTRHHITTSGQWHIAVALVHQRKAFRCYVAAEVSPASSGFPPTSKLSPTSYRWHLGALHCLVHRTFGLGKHHNTKSMVLLAVADIINADPNTLGRDRWNGLERKQTLNYLKSCQEPKEPQQLRSHRDFAPYNLLTQHPPANSQSNVLCTKKVGFRTWSALLCLFFGGGGGQETARMYYCG